ncbi:MAG TPA: class I SAM-dependent methyltransferase [Dehalococcoidia bacterium]|nr:class I SAM-dependent methyltransferase [Dehalococcoidia bacterium]
MAEQPLTPFDTFAREYDAWYESPYGASVLQREVECLRPLLQPTGRALEVGVGTGRFAVPLGIAHGVDPSLPMLRMAAGRGIVSVCGVGEMLPYRDGVFDAVLLAASLEFVAHARRVLEEARRTLRDDGTLVVGIINRESAWGGAYQQMATQGDPIFSQARFWTAQEAMLLGEAAGFSFVRARSTLLGPPFVIAEPDSREGAVAEAGFVAIAFRKREEETS